MFVSSRSLVFVALAALTAPVWAQVDFASPAGNVTGRVSVVNGRLTYNVHLGGSTILNDSPMGVSVRPNDTGAWIDLGADVDLGGVTVTTVDQTYAHNGNNATARNHYREYAVGVTHNSTGRDWTLRLRAYDNGVAYRYEAPLGAGEDMYSINGEASAWNLPAGSTAWWTRFEAQCEEPWNQDPVEDVDNHGVDLSAPLVYRTPGGAYGAITEGGTYYYSGMSLRPAGGNRFEAIFPFKMIDGADEPGWDHSTGWKAPPEFYEPDGDDRWRQRNGLQSGWRIVSASNDLNGLVNSNIVQNVNPPTPTHIDGQAVDWSFVQPGRALWSWWADSDVTYEQQLDYIDAAEQLDFEYVLVDDGWGGWNDKWTKIQNLVDYAADRDVKIWLWYHYGSMTASTWHDPENFRGEIRAWGSEETRNNRLAELAALGVAGIKVDFMNSESQYAMNFYEALLADAARHGLMVNYHGAPKGVGFERQFPNEMTREGVNGLERAKDTGQYGGGDQSATLPFTRMLAGHMDYTPVTLNPAEMDGSSAAHQIATAVAFLSPVQHWADDPNYYLNSPAVDVIRAMPTVWDETVVLDNSEIGQLAGFARRRGDQWFIGVINDPTARTETLDLGFLEGGWKAVLLEDDPADSTAMIRSDDVLLCGDDELTVELRGDGGFVAWLLELPAGDATGDGRVTDADYTIWADNFGMTGATWFDGDFNGDGTVTDADYTIWADNFGSAAAWAPEPASMGLLTLAGLATLGRRR